MNWPSYLIQVNIYLVLFYAFYVLVLQNETFFKWNRTFLVSSGVLSFLLPLVQSDWIRAMFVTKEIEEVTHIIVNPGIALGEVRLAPQDVNNGLGLTQWIVIAYLAGTVFFLCRFIWQLSKVSKSFNEGLQAKSFFRKVRVSNDLTSRECIIKHEEVHVSQLHSADVIFFELISIVNWFNPVVYAYKRDIRYIHEFIADEVASSESGKSEYALLLVSNVFGIKQEQLTNNFFNKSLLKKRIMMLHKTRSRRTALLKYGLSVPLFATMLVFSSAAIGKQEVGALKEVANVMPEVLNSVAAEIKTITDTNKENRSATPVDDKNTESSPAPGTAKDTELELASVGASDVSEMRSDTSTVFSIAKVDVMPAYPGGIGEFYKWVGQNYKYPKTAVEAGVRGRVIVQFVVERDGSLTDIKTVGRPLGYGTAEEAIRLLQTSKKWKPGVQTGRPVRVQYTLPINLELPQTEQRKDRTVTTSETPIRLSPTYPGGLDAFYTWFGKNFKLPKAAKEARFAGTLILTFTVENDGSLTNIKILKDLKGGEYGVGEEAKRVLALSQKWKPAIQNGKPVRMQYSLPIMISNPTSENNTRPPGAGKPLVIIDGKTFEKEIPAGFEFGTADDKTFAAVFGFKQADITSITVLKDKKETSKYGEKGKNGVLIIKTRAKK